MGTVEQLHKGVIHKLVEAFNSQDRKAFDSGYADPVVLNTQHHRIAMTHDEHWKTVEDAFTIFPDFHAELLGVIAEGRVSPPAGMTAANEILEPAQCAAKNWMLVKREAFRAAVGGRNDPSIRCLCDRHRPPRRCRRVLLGDTGRRGPERRTTWRQG